MSRSFRSIRPSNQRRHLDGDIIFAKLTHLLGQRSRDARSFALDRDINHK